MSPPSNCRERLLNALACQPNDRPPVWLMRQAGRCLPEYRELKTRYSFRDLITTPDLATEVTLQPIRRFHFDAAILFSDILVIPEALGVPFQFKDQGGLQMETIQNAADIAHLQTEGIGDKLHYVAQALRLIRSELAGKTGLLGFAGAPWTLANFMLEGGGIARYSKALELFHKDRDLYTHLSEKITTATIEYLKMQIDCGVDAVQLFDSLGGLLPNDDFAEASGQWIRQVVESINGKVPIILFAKGARNWQAQLQTKAQVLGIDHEIPMSEALQCLPATTGIQGNLNPQLLSTATPQTVKQAVTDLLQTMRGRNGYIFNLGHGVPPDARLENLETLAATVQNFS